MSRKKPRHKRRYAEVFLEHAPESQQRYEEIVEELSPRWKLRRSYKYYGPKTHEEELNLDLRFVKALTPETRVLEIGAGSARLANNLFKRTKLAPENYELMDTSYGGHPPFFKRKIFGLLNAGKIKAVKANALEYDYPQDYYDHILVPHAIVPEEHPQFSGRIKEGMPIGEAAAHIIATLVGRLAPSLRKRGSIRISTSWKEVPEIIASRNLLPEFSVKKVSGGRGMIFRKRSRLAISLSRWFRRVAGR